MLTNQGIDFLKTSIEKNLSHANARVNGSNRRLQIHRFNKTATGVQIFVYIDESISGNVSLVQLVFKTGHIFMEKQENITKDNQRGLLILFELKMEEVIQ